MGKISRSSLTFSEPPSMRLVSRIMQSTYVVISDEVHRHHTCAYNIVHISRRFGAGIHKTRPQNMRTRARCVVAGEAVYATIGL